MSEKMILLLTVTGAFVWLVIALAVVAFITLGILPALFRYCCYVGFSVMANKAEKEHARRLGRYFADIKAGNHSQGQRP